MVWFWHWSDHEDLAAGSNRNVRGAVEQCRSPPPSLDRRLRTRERRHDAAGVIMRMVALPVSATIRCPMSRTARPCG